MLSAFNLVYPYFTQEEVARFKLIWRSQNLPLHAAWNSAKLDALWHPFLNRLHSMDASVSMNPPCYNPSKPWRYERFVLGYDLIKEKQAKEIAALRANYPDLAKEHIDAIHYAGLSLLQQLESQHKALQKAKMAIPKQENQTVSLSPLVHAFMPAFEASKHPPLPEPLALDQELVLAVGKLKL